MAKGGREGCSGCGQKFTWTVIGDVWAGGKDKESIDCPTCHQTAGTVMTSGYVSIAVE